jgi:hypothetical protein
MEMLLQKRKHTPGRGTAALKSALLVSATAACIGIMSTSVASAGTIVEEWDFMLDNAFTDWTESGTGAPVLGSDFNTKISAIEGMPTPSKLSWGTPSNLGGLNPTLMQSSISVGFSNGNFDSTTDGGPMNDMDTPIITDISAPFVPVQMGNVVPTVKVTHNNFAIASGSTRINTAELTDILMLFPQEPPGVMPGPHTVAPLVFNILFAETPNAPNTGDDADPDECADTDSPAGGGCNDIFVLEVPAAAFDPMDGSLNQQFEFDMFNYNAKIQVAGLDMLTDEECAAAGAEAGCLGLTTQENMANDFQAFLSIQLIGEAPEPGAVAIFGLGLAGLGFMRRRRKA